MKIDREALEGFLGTFRWLSKYGLFLLTSSTFTSVKLTFSHNSTVLATCFKRVLFRITGIRGMIGKSIPWTLSSRCTPTCFIRVHGSVCKACEGRLVLFKRNMSWVVMLPRFAIRVHDTAFRIMRRGIYSIQKERISGWTMSMQRLEAWIPFL